jgi:hypothetical protein
MPLFNRKPQAPAPPPTGDPVLDAHAHGQGWQPLGPAPFGDEISACFVPYTSGYEVGQRINQLWSLAAAIPDSVPHATLRTLPDGTLLTDRDPDRVEAAFAAMSPDQQAAFLAGLERRRAELRQRRQTRS